MAPILEQIWYANILMSAAQQTIVTSQHPIPYHTVDCMGNLDIKSMHAHHSHKYQNTISGDENLQCSLKYEVGGL